MSVKPSHSTDRNHFAINTRTVLHLFFFSRLPIQGCFLTGCLNGGSCLFDEKKQTISCLCTPGWTGEKCQIGKKEPSISCSAIIRSPFSPRYRYQKEARVEQCGCPGKSSRDKYCC